MYYELIDVKNIQENKTVAEEKIQETQRCFNSTFGNEADGGEILR